MPDKLHGVFPAMATPMTTAEEIDYGTLEKLTDYLIGAGVHGLIPLGSTGEYYALTPQERHDVLETVMRAAAGRVPVVAGANAGSTRDVIAYCREAETLGAAGVLLAPPYYSLPRPDEVFEHFRAVDAAIGIPIMLYNYPGRAGVDMLPELVERLASLKNVQYIKESTGEVQRMSEIMRRCGDRLTVFCGCDTLALESFVLGVTGWVAGVANFLPEAHVKLYDAAVVRKDFCAARELYFRLLPTLAMMEGGGKYTQYVKAACALVGHPAGPPRRPLLPATAAEIEQLREVIARV
jgi:4-hydroxy-tetrahydrodipicolinate synthase